MSGSQLRKLLKEGDIKESAAKANLKSKLIEKKDTVDITEQKRALVDQSAAIESHRLGVEEYFTAIMQGGVSAIDEHSYTPARIIHVFFKETFSNVFLESHANVVVILLAILLAILGYYERINELEDQVRESRGGHYILSRLIQKKKEQLADKVNADEIVAIKDELQKVATELFPGVEVILEKDANAPGGIKFELKNDPQKIFPLEEKQNKSIVGKASDLVSNAWSLLSNYSMFYWIVWMSAIIIAGAALTPALGFGLPAIIPGLYLLWKVTEWVFNKQHPLPSETLNTKFNKLLIFRAYADKLNLDDLKARLKEKLKSVEPQEVEKKGARISIEDSSTTESKASEPEKKLFKNLFERKAFIMTLAVATTLVSGYVVAVFNQWPIIDLLTNVLHISSVGTAVALSPTAVFICFGIALGIGLFLAVREGFKKHQEIEANRKTAKEFSAASAEILNLKNKYQQTRNRVKALLANKKDNSEDYKLLDTILKELPDLSKAERASFLTQVRRYVAMWITGAGSGVFVIRSILLAGCIIPLLLGPVSWTLSFAVAMVAGVIWGSFKVMALMQKREEEYELEMIETMPHVKWTYEEHIELLNLMEKSAAMIIEPKSKPVAEKNEIFEQQAVLKLEQDRIASLSASSIPVSDSSIAPDSSNNSSFHPTLVPRKTSQSDPKE